MNAARGPQGDDDSDDPFIPDMSEGVETGMYLALFELLDEGLIITGDEIVLEANSAACRLLERDYRQIAGKPLADLFPSEQAFLEARGRLFIQGEMRGSLQVSLPGARHRNLRFVAAARIRPGVHALILSPDVMAEAYAEAAPSDTLWPRLAAALEQPVIVIDADGKVAAANAAALKTLNVERDKLVGHPLDACVGLEWPASGEVPIARLRPRGRKNYLSARVLPGPKPDWRLLILPPATRHAAPPAAARAGGGGHRDFFERMCAESPLPTLLCEGPEQRIFAANAAAALVYGHSREALCAMKLAELRAPGNVPGELTECRVWQHRRQDGSVFDVELLAYPIDAPNRPGAMVLMHDLPDAPLLASQLRLPVSVFEAANQAILVTDAECRILAVNRAFTAISGYTLAEAKGRNPSLLGSGRHDREFYAEMWRTINETGQWQGEIWNRRKGGAVFPEWLSITAVRSREGDTLHYIGIFSDLSAKRQAESRADYLAHHDTLTGLPNRRLFETRFTEAMVRAEQPRRSVGLLRIDLDNFKAVNREYDHDTGDTLLQQVARRLLGALPPGGTAARERSDTFLAMLPDIDIGSDVGRAAEAMLGALTTPFQVGGRDIRLSASIGIALFPEDGSSFDVLMRHAVAALLHARQLGGNNAQYFTDEMDAVGIERVAFETNLRQAVEHDQLEAHFQPLVDVRDRRVRGGEALLRWRHPDLGLIPFRRFMGVARDVGLLTRMGDWVLHAACAHAAAWATVDGSAPCVTVNVAIEQIMHGDLVERVRHALAQSGLPPQRLELDLDELVLKEENARILTALTTLHEMGVRLAIDDFGRGLASIPKLKRYPLRALKLDPALVREVGTREDSEAIVEAITSMAGVFGLDVLARGVESEAQRAFLSALGCHLQQGPLFGRPMSAEDFQAFLEKRGADR